MVKLLGLNKKKTNKKRLSPSARTEQGRREKHPMYQYALNEYAQTVAAGSGNDTGSAGSSWYEDTLVQVSPPPPPSTMSAARDIIEPASTMDSLHAQPSGSHGAGGATAGRLLRDPRTTSESKSTHATASEHSLKSFNKLGLNPSRSPFEAEMPDATYEEYYGDAYVGGTIKYVYPSGYQSMRPRSCPWKLSIVVCMLFTWLSVFIVGHCSDQVDLNEYRNDEFDDDALVYDIRWCGSRPLYLMWVMSMLITGLAAAYCSVIGYIKVRDFAVGNSRSQPPGVVSGKSDYYVRIEDGIRPALSSSSEDYRPSIYQSDGTPQFWGAHIYRPTQAAVAITSR